MNEHIQIVPLVRVGKADHSASVSRADQRRVSTQAQHFLHFCGGAVLCLLALGLLAM